MPMEMTGEFRIPAPRQRVWEGLNDPEILKSVIPGCQTLEKVSDTEFTGKMVAAIGPVKATFAGKVMLSDLDPPQSYTISGEGSGGVAGFAKGSAKVNLAEDGAGTVLNYAVQAHVGGKLAQIGSRLIDSVARKMAEQFFGRFVAVIAPEQPTTAASGAAEIEAVGASPVAAEPPLAPGEAAPMTSAEAQPGAARPETEPAKLGDVRLPPVLWVTGLAAIIGAMLYFFTGRRVTR
jgi:carbon monoxide dehydrogenase subunit G